MDIKRIMRHLLTTDAQVRKAFPRITLDKIEHAIQASESSHVGEIRFAVEGALDGAPLFKGQSARERALDLFAQLRNNASPRSVKSGSTRSNKWPCC